jgi:hypothetical protein
MTSIVLLVCAVGAAFLCQLFIQAGHEKKLLKAKSANTDDSAEPSKPQ